MEPPSRFNLDQAVAAWREELARQPGLTPADRRELEAHLRDGFAELKKKELSDEEAFMVARHRVGPPWAVAAEFAKATPKRLWAPRIFWLAFSLLTIEVFQLLVAMVRDMVSLQALFDPVLKEEMPYIAGALLGISRYGPLLIAAWWLVRGVPRLVANRWRVAALGCGIFLFPLGVDLFYRQVIFPLMAEGTFQGTLMPQFVFTREVWHLSLIGLMVWLTPGRAKTNVHTVAA